MTKAPWLAILLLTPSITAAEERAPEKQWVCSTTIDGDHGSDVGVSIQLTASRFIVARYASWNPPETGRDSKAYRTVEPVLSLNYDPEGAGTIGPLTGAWGIAAGTGVSDEALGP